MSIQFRSSNLTPAEASFLKFQYGFDDQDDPFARVLWQAIKRAWDSDTAPGASRATSSASAAPAPIPGKCRCT